MSRSRRKTPKVGITNSASDKLGKQFAARRERRWIGAHLDPQVATVEDFEIVPEHEHHRHGQWIFPKDGKVWIGNSRWRDVAKWLRK
jgi:hypothetical protein